MRHVSQATGTQQLTSTVVKRCVQIGSSGYQPLSEPQVTILQFQSDPRSTEKEVRQKRYPVLALLVLPAAES